MVMLKTEQYNLKKLPAKKAVKDENDLLSG